MRNQNKNTLFFFSSKRFLDAYGKDMEFCQLQLNYIDWTFQNGREKVELLDSWHIPVRCV